MLVRAILKAPRNEPIRDPALRGDGGIVLQSRIPVCADPCVVPEPSRSEAVRDPYVDGQREWTILPKSATLRRMDPGQASGSEPCTPSSPGRMDSGMTRLSYESHSRS